MLMPGGIQIRIPGTGPGTLRGGIWPNVNRFGNSMQLATKRPPGANTTNFNTPICTLKPCCPPKLRIFHFPISTKPCPKAFLTHKMRIKHTQLETVAGLAKSKGFSYAAGGGYFTSIAPSLHTDQTHREPLERLTSCTPTHPATHLTHPPTHTLAGNLCAPAGNINGFFIHQTWRQTSRAASAKRRAIVV